MGGLVGQPAGMPEDSNILVILLAGVFGVLVVILVVLGAIARSVSRMERKIGRQGGVDPAPQVAPSIAESARKTLQKEDFMEFLKEEPERRQLPKREQFAAYRKWRKERGLNWPQAGGNGEAA